MASKYYYFITSLPELSLQDKSLLYSNEEFREVLAEFLDKDDFELIRILYYSYDIKNLANLIKETGEPHQSQGNFTAEDLKASLVVPETLPAFMEKFIYESQPSWAMTSFHDIYNSLTTYFIEWTRNISNPFLHQWFEFIHNLRNVVAGLNSRKFNRDIHAEVLGDHFEAEKMKRNKDRDFGLSKVIDGIDRIITSFHQSDLALRESMIDQLCWDFVESLDENYHFSLENLMAYVIKIRLVERDILSSDVVGQERINYLLNNMKKGHELPEQFA